MAILGELWWRLFRQRANLFEFRTGLTSGTIRTSRSRSWSKRRPPIPFAAAPFRDRSRIAPQPHRPPRTVRNRPPTDRAPSASRTRALRCHTTARDSGFPPASDRRSRRTRHALKQRFAHALPTRAFSPGTVSLKLVRILLRRRDGNTKRIGRIQQSADIPFNARPLRDQIRIVSLARRSPAAPSPRRFISSGLRGNAAGFLGFLGRFVRHGVRLTPG